ncbi:hypothetical protein V8C40DRAFT_147885 [Trichoderma camerunense]
MVYPCIRFQLSAALGSAQDQMLPTPPENYRFTSSDTVFKRERKQEFAIIYMRSCLIPRRSCHRASMHQYTHTESHPNVNLSGDAGVARSTPAYTCPLEIPSQSPFKPAKAATSVMKKGSPRIPSQYGRRPRQLVRSGLSRQGAITRITSNRRPGRAEPPRGKSRQQMACFFSFLGLGLSPM